MGRPYRQGGQFEKREKLRKYLFVKQDGFCWLCGDPMTLQRSTQSKKPGKIPSNFATFDHVVPVSEGGTCRTSNLKLACQWCNSARPHYYKETIIGSTVFKVTIGDFTQSGGSGENSSLETRQGLCGPFSEYFRRAKENL